MVQIVKSRRKYFVDGDNSANETHCCFSMAALKTFIFLTATSTPTTIKR
jgi:hypothetical protein